MDLQIILYYYDENGQYRVANINPDMKDGTIFVGIAVEVDGQAFIDRRPRPEPNYIFQKIEIE